MILTTMTRAEIADHLRNEFRNNKDRIGSKMRPILKKLKKASLNTFCYSQITPNKTTLTIYIYDAQTGGYVIGAWFNSINGKTFASVGVQQVTFYNDHFFLRYAERFLKNKTINVLDAAKEYFKTYNIAISTKDRTNPITENVYDFILHLKQGFGLGYADEYLNISVIKTFVPMDMLFEDQLIKFKSTESYRDLVNDLDKNHPLLFKEIYKDQLKKEGIDNETFENYTT